MKDIMYDILSRYRLYISSYFVRDILNLNYYNFLNLFLIIFFNFYVYLTVFNYKSVGIFKYHPL